MLWLLVPAKNKADFAELDSPIRSCTCKVFMMKI